MTEPTTGGETSSQVVVLGASNVSLGFPYLLRLIQSALPQLEEMYACHGHGRSYGNWSKVVVRELPGIVDSQLWNVLEEAAMPQRRMALITDIGNDLVYGVRTDQIVEWVETCLKRLSSSSTQVTMTQLPLDSLSDVGSFRFRVFRAICFPTRTVNWDQMAKDIQTLSTEIRRLAAEYNANLFVPPAEWYGLDPIHIQSQYRFGGWREILELWEGFEVGPDPDPPGILGWTRHIHKRPLEWKFAGNSRSTPQPCITRGNLKVHLY